MKSVFECDGYACPSGGMTISATSYFLHTVLDDDRIDGPYCLFCAARQMTVDLCGDVFVNTTTVRVTEMSNELLCGTLAFFAIRHRSLQERGASPSYNERVLLAARAKALRVWQHRQQLQLV